MNTSFWQMAVSFFLVTNPIGNSPMFLGLLKDFDFATQRKILLREGLISLAIALFFQYLGEIFLNLLNVQDYAMTFCGGVLLLIISLKMIFPFHRDVHSEGVSKEPFIVPIATPLLAGPGVLTLIMLSSRQLSHFMVSGAIFLAWAGVIAVMAIAPYLQKIFGKKGLTALEQVMGMLLALMAIHMLVHGAELFLNVLEK